MCNCGCIQVPLKYQNLRFFLHSLFVGDFKNNVHVKNVQHEWIFEINIFKTTEMFILLLLLFCKYVDYILYFLFYLTRFHLFSDSHLYFSHYSLKKNPYDDTPSLNFSLLTSILQYITPFLSFFKKLLLLCHGCNNFKTSLPSLFISVLPPCIWFTFYSITFWKEEGRKERMDSSLESAPGSQFVWPHCRTDNN